MSVLEIFRWLDNTAIGNGIRDSTNWFPSIEVVHLLGLTILYGAVLVLDLRLLGFGLRRQSITTVAREVNRYLFLGIGIMLVTGIPLFLSEALKCYTNEAFWFKMGCLLLALIFQFAIHRRVLSTDHPNPIFAKFAAVSSMLLWFGVGLGGRAIAFV